jgi:Domain of unknown function (DUF4290)
MTDPATGRVPSREAKPHWAVKPHLQMEHTYNTDNSHLVLKEYGRNVQKLAEYLVTLKSKEERTALAHVLINLMKQLNPSVRENSDNNQRIWDHLHFMADLKLDIDGPYPVPEEGSLYKKPKRVGYNMNRIAYKHYGRNVELLIEKVVVLEDPEEKMAASIYIFKLMKGFYATWNKENTDDEIIIQQLKELSGGRIALTPADLRAEATTQERKHPQNQNQHQHQHQQNIRQYQQNNPGNQSRHNPNSGGGNSNNSNNSNRFNHNRDKRRK